MSGEVLVPTLTVLKQNSLAQEIIERDDVQHNLHVVVKHSPFVISLGTTLAPGAGATVSPPTTGRGRKNTKASARKGGKAPNNSSLIDISKCDFKCSLHYWAVGEKEVDFVNSKPMEYKLRNSSSAGSNAQVDIECRLKVLTSQLEDMKFLVRFVAHDSDGKPLGPSMVCQSEPIKVISKPEQVRKKRKKGTKRSAHEMLLEGLERLEAVQTTSQSALSRLQTEMDALQQSATAAASAVPAHPPAAAPDLQQFLDAEKKIDEEMEADEVVDLEHSFREFQDAYASLPSEDSTGHRQEKMRRLIQMASNLNHFDELFEMIDLFSSEGLQRNLGHEVDLGVGLGGGGSGGGLDPSSLSAHNDTCECPGCPHKEELERIESFYKEVFSL